MTEPSTAVVTEREAAAPAAGTGRVIVEVHTPGNAAPADLCAAAVQFWGIGGSCALRDVRGTPVGVVTRSEDPRIDQAAAYRYPDGTVVYAAQSKEPNNLGMTGNPVAGSLPQLPLTVDQLAALVLNPAFKIG